MKPEDWYASFETFRWHGHAIPFRHEPREGAPRLLLIHGFPTASWDWHRVWDELALRFEMLTLDLIGFGWAAKPVDHPYSIRNQADLVQDLLGTRGFRNPHVLAHDYGDSVAQELLARHADGSGPPLASCCFLNGGLIPSMHRPTFVQRLLGSALGPLVAKAMNRRKFARAFSEVFGPHSQPTEEELDICWDLIERHQGRRVMSKLIGYMKERRRFADRWVGVLEAPPVPLRLIDGALDPVSGRHLADAFARIVPNADVVILDDIGHYPQLEAPGVVHRAAIEFFDRHVE